MAYRNKTYVAFASEDINSYWLMKAWKENENIAFDFFDAHDLNSARDSSSEETIKRRLRERLANTKQAIVLVSDNARRKYSNGSFLSYELDVINKLELPVVFAMLDGSREMGPFDMPPQIGWDYYSITVAFQARIIQYALDDYVTRFNASRCFEKGACRYSDSVYQSLGL